MSADTQLKQMIIDELRELRQDVKEIKAEMTTLKVKVALFSSIISSAATFILNRVLQ